MGERQGQRGGEKAGKERGGVASYGEKERRGGERCGRKRERKRGRERKGVEGGDGSGNGLCEIIEVTFTNQKHDIEAIISEREQLRQSTAEVARNTIFEEQQQ